ncbi:MAG: regulatory iron-sulfur-containing complex subunit RicT [bacterium]|nr:regulatory iron-sulfur-containing complex subunit RicT [bacterium]
MTQKPPESDQPEPEVTSPGDSDPGLDRSEDLQTEAPQAGDFQAPDPVPEIPSELSDPDTPDPGIQDMDADEGTQEADADPHADLEADPSDFPAGIRTVLVGIRGQNRTAHFNAGEHTLNLGDEVVVQTEHGKNIGVVMEPPVTLEYRGCRNLKILRKANPEEVARDVENRELEKKALEFCTRTVEDWEIPMRLVQVEFLLDRSKAIFFFTAEKRVDFRELVRILAREFSTRIEMRQIGIRDEARLLGGIGPCGMAFCCSTFLKEFAPISVKMAKEQNVILNPNKISGGCGRLLCCLNYEYDMYKEASRGVPKIGKKVNLPEGTGKVRSVDIFARTVTIDLPEEKKNIVMDIDELREKLK